VDDQLSREAQNAVRWLWVTGVSGVVGFAALPVDAWVDVPALKVVVVVAGVVFSGSFAMAWRWNKRMPDDQ
jgi:hypothetical protein